MAVNKAGVEQLKADLRHDVRRYNQFDFYHAATQKCGTEVCLAGMCYIRQVGEKQFEIEGNKESYSSFVHNCLKAGENALGLTLLSEEENREGILTQFDLDEQDDVDPSGLPQIFERACCWPVDLRDRYNEAFDNHDHKEMVEVACDALDRIDEYGFISNGRVEENASKTV